MRMNDYFMEKCNPVDMRRTLEIVDGLKKSGIGFVPIPVMNERDRESLNRILMSRLDRMALAAIELENGAKGD